jgi:glycosyltransferase involved in cell wall biosynthesis
MPSVVHIVVTNGFAGVERHISDTAGELANRNWDVTVIGGDPTRMPSVLGREIIWLPGATPTEALHSVSRLRRQDICHVHMTFAETVGVCSSPVHRAPVVSTRHFAARRGSTPLARIVSHLIAVGISRELAISDFVANSVERRPAAVVRNGVRASDCLWDGASRSVLVLQRLDREKDTITALRAWEQAHMWEDGWSLRIVGDGSERPTLERWAAGSAVPAVTFIGWSDDVDAEFAKAAVLLAPAPAEPLGLAVLEAMAAGVPVVACEGGGHLETVGRLPDPKLFAPGDVRGAAAQLRSLSGVEKREVQSVDGRVVVAADFRLADRVDDLLEQYGAVGSPRRRTPLGSSQLATTRAHTATTRGPTDRAQSGTLDELVVCSLEAWDEVWRRNQHITDRLMRRNPRLRVLFVEPPADPIFDAVERRRPSFGRFRRIGSDGRLLVLRPVKVLPRRIAPGIDATLRAQVLAAVRFARFSQPHLWINDVTYAPLIGSRGWASMYDVTDDWLAAPLAARELRRIATLEAIALREAAVVVVCSEALARSRGKDRNVELVPNAVDSDRFDRSYPRPRDLPPSPVAIYVGSLHESRLDVRLIVDVAQALPSLRLLLIGPDSLRSSTRRYLGLQANVTLLGTRPYTAIPAYLQHADVILIPHLLNEFTQSLDPIKAYESVASGTPTVSTPVAGLVGLAPFVSVASRAAFPKAVEKALSAGRRTGGASLPSWDERAERFERILLECPSRATKLARRRLSGSTLT